jgi:hypothetical protein
VHHHPTGSRLLNWCGYIQANSVFTLAWCFVKHPKDVDVTREEIEIDDLIVGKYYYWFRTTSDVWEKVLESEDIHDVVDGVGAVEVLFKIKRHIKRQVTYIDTITARGQDAFSVSVVLSTTLQSVVYSICASSTDMT